MVTKRQRREAVAIKRDRMLEEERKIGLLAQEADKARREYDKEHPVPEVRKKSQQNSRRRDPSTANS